MTVNLPRIGYLSRTEEEFKSRLLDLMEIAKESLEIKRKTIEEQTRRGMYPYSAHYLENVKERTGSYWFNHFNTNRPHRHERGLPQLHGQGHHHPRGAEIFP